MTTHLNVMNSFKVLLMSSVLFMISAKADNQVSTDTLYKFSNAINLIKSTYVQEVTDKQILEAAINGVLTNLDPHSEYLNKEKLVDLNESIQGEFGGLGIQIALEKGVVKVITPLDDTPAFKAGIKPGDLIVKIDGKFVEGKSLTEISNELKGDIGTPVTITVVRIGENSPFDINLIRDRISVPIVKSKLYDNSYAYIRVAGFQENTVNELKNAFKKMLVESNNNLKGIVLDLRNNPGGLLSSAIGVSDLFLNANNLALNKLIVYTKGRDQYANTEAKATQNDISKNIPLVVLVNHGSASASEIVAGAIQDHKRGIVIGENTFGKGSVQTIIPMDRESGIKITTARYYTPAGKEIQGIGIVPDIKVEHIDLIYDKEKVASLNKWKLREKDIGNSIDPTSMKLDDSQIIERYTTDDKDQVPLVYKDNQLNSAIDILKALSKNK